MSWLAQTTKLRRTVVERQEGALRAPLFDTTLSTLSRIDCSRSVLVPHLMFVWMRGAPIAWTASWQRLIAANTSSPLAFDVRAVSVKAVLETGIRDDFLTGGDVVGDRNTDAHGNDAKIGNHFHDRSLSNGDADRVKSCNFPVTLNSIGAPRRRNAPRLLIISPLDSGGMGAVYRTRDTKLGLKDERRDTAQPLARFGGIRGVELLTR